MTNKNLGSGVVNITLSKAHSAIIIHLREIKYFLWWSYIVKFDGIFNIQKQKLDYAFQTAMFPFHVPEK